MCRNWTAVELLRLNPALIWRQITKYQPGQAKKKWESEHEDSSRHCAAWRTKRCQPSIAAREEDYKVQLSKSYWMRRNINLWLKNSLCFILPPFCSAMENSGSSILATKYDICSVPPGAAVGIIPFEEKGKRNPPDTHLSMWAALNTTSNSPPSRRAAFSAISAASSSRDSSNKNWPGGVRENRSTVEMLRDPRGGTEGYVLRKCWTWLCSRARAFLASKIKLWNTRYEHSIPAFFGWRLDRLVTLANLVTSVYFQ